MVALIRQRPHLHAKLKEATASIVSKGKYKTLEEAVEKIAILISDLHQHDCDNLEQPQNDVLDEFEAEPHAEQYPPEEYTDMDYREAEPHAVQYPQEEYTDMGYREDPECDYGDRPEYAYEQVSSIAVHKHKAYQKALTQVDKISPNTRSRKLDDYLTEMHFHAELTYGNDAWENNPIALKAIVMTTFNMDLRRQFLKKNAYESTTWSALQAWLKASTDQAPDDIKLQAITKLRLNQHSQGKKTLAEYNTQFTTLLQHAMMDTPEHTSWAIQTYIAGLNCHISSQLIMNPVTNQHWLTLDEVKQCAYRLNYHNHQTKSFPSLAALQTPPPAPSRGRGGPPGRGRSLTRGRGGGGRGRTPGSRGGYGQGGRGRYDQDGRGGYGQGGRGRHDQDGRSGYGPRGRGDHNREGRGGYQGDRDGGPKQGSHPSQINRSLWIFQEKYLRQKGVCPSCFGDLNQCSREGQHCPLTHRPTEIWDVPASKLKGCTLTKLQRNGVYPENA